MASFKDTWDLTLLSNSQGMNLIKISCCCTRLTAPKITICRIYSYPEFDLDEVNEDECRDQFSYLA